MYPPELTYTSDHEWVKDIGGGVVRIGITWFAQDALGDIVYVALPEAGRQVTAGESFAEVESTKSVSDIYAPVTGKVVEVNDELNSAPEKINGDPYGEGWIAAIEMSDPAELGGLMDAAAYEALTS